MNIVKSLKNQIKQMGFGNVKYHTFTNRTTETLKFYTCSPNDSHIADLNWYMYNNNIPGSAKRVITDKKPNGFLEVMIRQ